MDVQFGHVILSISGKTPTEWLANSSFQTQVPVKRELSNFSPCSSSDESARNASNIKEQIKSKGDTKISAKQEELKLQKRKKTEHKKNTSSGKRSKAKYKQNVENVYFEDKHRDRGNNTISTFCSRVRPVYNVSEKTIGFARYKQPRKDTFHRYYIKNIDSAEASKKKDAIIKKTSEKEIVKGDEANENLYSWCNNIDEEQKRKTREYNEQLMQNPRDIDLWLQYLDFQVLQMIFLFCMLKLFNCPILYLIIVQRVELC